MPKSRLENFVGIVTVSLIGMTIIFSIGTQMFGLMSGEKNVGGLYGGRGNVYMDF